MRAVQVLPAESAAPPRLPPTPTRQRRRQHPDTHRGRTATKPPLDPRPHTNQHDRAALQFQRYRCHETLQPRRQHLKGPRTSCHPGRKAGLILKDGNLPGVLVAEREQNQSPLDHTGGPPRRQVVDLPDHQAIRRFNIARSPPHDQPRPERNRPASHRHDRLQGHVRWRRRRIVWRRLRRLAAAIRGRTVPAQPVGPTLTRTTIEHKLSTTLEN